MRTLVIPLVGSLGILAGCQTPRIVQKPPRPIIESVRYQGNGYCVDETNARLLNQYIMDLERGYR